ncbi:MAG: hypothetical protein HOW97_18025 [Catenulispora sp.]|nr:hypothetical protein [Catenulispora sp.]
MGWSNGGAYRSAGAMHELGQHMAHVLPAGEWRAVQSLFRSAQWADGPFEIAPADTRRMAAVFRAAAGHRLMPREWAVSADELAAVAEQHATRGVPWEWR